MSLNRRGMSHTEIAFKLGVTEQTVRNWDNGYAVISKTERRPRNPPPYIEDALKAAKEDLRGAAKEITCGYWKELGVERQHASYWRKTGQVPGPARMAVAWIIHRRVTGKDIT